MASSDLCVAMGHTSFKGDKEQRFDGTDHELQCPWLASGHL